MENSRGFEVKLDAFEGPFDLLYELITHRELSIFEIELAQITSEYLKYVRKISDIDVELAGEFLLIAAVLMELKSKGLFPKDEADEPEEVIEPDEARELLIQRLCEYKRYKNASMEMLARFEAFSRYFPRDCELEEPFSRLKPDFAVGYTADDLYHAFSRMLRDKNTVVDATHMINIKYTVEDKAVSIMSTLAKERAMSFKDLTKDCSDRLEVVFYFLATLELLKNGNIECSQYQSFGDINIALVDIDMPFDGLGHEYYKEQAVNPGSL